MDNRFFSTDILLAISDYVDMIDIYTVGATCSTARKLIRRNGFLWKAIVCKRYPSNLWAKLDLDLDEYITLATRKEKTMTQELHRMYILYRLGLPMSSKEALRVYIEITTPTLPAPHDKTILTGTIMIVDEDELRKSNTVRTFSKLSASLDRSRKGLTNSNLSVSSSLSVSGDLSSSDENVQVKSHSEKKIYYKIAFKKADGKSFYFWYDREQNHYSAYRFYTVDRCSRNAMDITKSKFNECVSGLNKSKTILSKDDHALIASILKTDIAKEATRSEKVKTVRGENGREDNHGAEMPIDPMDIDDGIVRQVDRIGNGLLNHTVTNLFSMRERSAGPDVTAYTEWTIDVNFETWFTQLVFP